MTDLIMLAGMSYILEGLYLGGIDDACDKARLKTMKVTHILTIDLYVLTHIRVSLFVFYLALTHCQSRMI